MTYLIRSQDLSFGAKIGDGSFGAVYRGTWQHSEVAIKQLHAQQLTADSVQELEREASIMAGLHHSNIIQLRGVCLEPEHYSLIMDFMPKGSLYSVLHNQAEPLPWIMRWRIAFDIARGILHLHQHQPPILHRDLKSGNVLLDEHYHAKVTDFGLAKLRTETRTTTALPTGQSAGTLPWAAPETLGLRPKFSQAADVYSLGMIFWELASRETPYKDVIDNIFIVQAVKSGEREKIPPKTPPHFVELIGHCWAERAEDRFSAERVVQFIENELTQLEQEERVRLRAELAVARAKSAAPEIQRITELLQKIDLDARARHSETQRSLSGIERQGEQLIDMAIANPAPFSQFAPSSQ